MPGRSVSSIFMESSLGPGSSRPQAAVDLRKGKEKPGVVVRWCHLCGKLLAEGEGLLYFDYEDDSPLLYHILLLKVYSAERSDLLLLLLLILSSLRVFSEPPEKKKSCLKSLLDYYRLQIQPMTVSIA